MRGMEIDELYATARFAYKVANGKIVSEWGKHPFLLALSLKFIEWFERTCQRPFGDDAFVLTNHPALSPIVMKQLKRIKKSCRLKEKRKIIQTGV